MPVTSHGIRSPTRSVLKNEMQRFFTRYPHPNTQLRRVGDLVQNDNRGGT